MPRSKGVRFPRKPLMVDELEAEVEELTEKSDQYLFALKEIIADIDHYDKSDDMDLPELMQQIRNTLDPFRYEDV